MKKKLIVKQADENDCGACCLLSIIKYYGGNSSLELLKVETNTSNLGTNAYEIIKCAEKYGLEGTGIKNHDINKIKTPFIAHLKIKENFHFIVVYKIEKEHLIIMDPSKGKEKIKESIFLKQFTGNLIILRPSTTVLYLEKNSTLIHILKNFFKYNKKTFKSYYFISLILLLIDIIFSLIIKILIDSQNILLYTNIFFLLLVVKLFLTYKKNTKESFLENLLKLNLNYQFFNHIISLPLKYVQLKTSGEIFTKFKEVNKIAEASSNFLFKTIFELLSALIILVVVTLYKFKLAIIIYLFLIFYSFVSLIQTKRLIYKINKSINLESECNTLLDEYINNILNINMLNCNNYFIKNFNKVLLLKNKNKSQFDKMIIIFSILKETIYLSFYIITILYSFYLNYSIVDLITFLNLEIIIFDNIQSIFNDIPIYLYEKQVFLKISDFFGLPSTIKLENKYIYDEIKFNNVTFKYNECNKYTYNFKINKNEHVMIKGKNGTGKSTMCKLLLRIYENYEGTIEIGNTNIMDINKQILKNSISIAHQNSNIFHDTIKNNIMLNKQYSEKLFNKIAFICDLESLVSKKNNRYETIIYEKSFNLSGGEMQKIILARTLIKPAKIIILDETLSELSIESEIEIIKKLNLYLKDKTIIYITHRNFDKYFKRVITLN